MKRIIVIIGMLLPGAVLYAHPVMPEKALQVARDCGCRQGCPSCAGPVGEIGEDGKATAMYLLKELTK